LKDELNNLKEEKEKKNNNCFELEKHYQQQLKEQKVFKKLYLITISI
jgi:hypothetical protein